MDINRGNMNALFTGYNMTFQSGLGMAPDKWQQFAGVFNSNTDIEAYPFLEQFGGMREWIGDRQIKNISSKKLEVKNRDFEDTVSVKKNDVMNDRYGLYNSMIAQMGQNAGKLWNDLAFEALTGNGNWLDGAAFFGTSRKYGANTISNYVAAALTSTTFNTAYQTMMEYKGHSNKMLGVTPNLLVVGPKLRTTAWDILKNQFTYDATAKVQVQNVNQNVCDLLVVSDLSGTYDDYWFLMQTTGVLKPVMVQKREEPKLTRLDKDDDEAVFMRKEFIYGTEAMGAAFLAMPHLAYAGIL
jgi:phage major head subunit gpT-like protein